MLRVPALALAVLVVAAGDAGAADRDVARAVRDLAAADAVPVARRVEAAGVLGATAPGEARDAAMGALTRALGDPSPDVRVAVASALARLDDRRAVAPLLARLGDEPDDGVRAALVLAVGAAGAPEDAGSLDLALAAPSVRLRAAVVTALGDLGGGAARARLLDVLARPGDDPEWAVRGGAMLALARCGTREDAGAVLVAYRDGGGAARWFARAALATVVGALDPDPVPILDRLVADDDPRVSVSAARAFVRARRAGELVARLADPRPVVRAAAAAAVADEAVPGQEERLRALATGDPVRAVRWSAALALSRLDDPVSDALLVEGVGADDPQVWATAIAECRRKTGLELGRDADAWGKALARRRRELAR
ncbi:MAG: HEAT repeat domain-containing protein [Planctomycetes bacterium]|nr:HEAT repeat domain-containing protein [Planctomycetota bacterium]